MSEKKTHWRTFHETEFLGAFDLTEQGVNEVNLTIVRASSQKTKDEKGKEEIVLSCTFEGVKKPMILNATNCKAIEKVSGSPFIDNWSGVTITVYILKGIKAFGKIVDGLRIKEYAPKIEVPKNLIDEAVAIMDNCKTIDELKQSFEDCEHSTNVRVIAAKDKAKKLLE